MKNIINALFGRYFPEGISEARLSDITDFVSEKIYKEYKDHNINKERKIKSKTPAICNCELLNK